MIDDRLPALTELVGAAELSELCDPIARALAARVAVRNIAGARAAGTEVPEPLATAEILCAGELIGQVFADGVHAEAAASAVAAAVELVAHHAYARRLAGSTHEAAMALSYGELTSHNHRLEHAVASLEQAERVKANFLATMSHELRTPLTSVIGYTEILLEGIAGPVTDGQREHLQTILGKADQLLQIISAILDVANLQAGRTAVEYLPVELGELVTSTLGGFANLAERRGLVFDRIAGGDGSSPLRVLGDRRQLRQIVSNLVSNAVKFSPDRGHIEIELRPGPQVPSVPESPPGVHLVVRDRGIGVDPEAVAQVFDPFFQADSSSTRAYGGTGLGLTLAKAYVEAHGGEIWVEQTPGGGATFVATFPAVPPDA